METSDSSPPRDLLPTPTVMGNHNRGGSSPKAGDGLATALSRASTSSRAASPASLFPPLDEGGERATTATSGRRCFALYGSSALGSSWARMLGASLLGTEGWYSPKSSLTWKLRATKRGPSLFQLAPSARPTGGTAFGLLLTPSATVQIEEPPESMRARAEKNGYKNGTKWNSLASQVMYGMLPTVRASDGEKGGPNSRDGSGSLHLTSVVARLPSGTPGAKTGLRLQPAFALWMMGYPEDWLDPEAGEAPPSKGRGTQSSRR